MSLDRYDQDDAMQERHEKRIVRCTSCRAMIIFLPTEAGRKMPCDSDTVEPEDEVFDFDRHTSHFATCSSPEKHRKAR